MTIMTAVLLIIIIMIMTVACLTRFTEHGALLLREGTLVVISGNLGLGLGASDFGVSGLGTSRDQGTGLRLCGKFNVTWRRPLRILGDS